MITRVLEGGYRTISGHMQQYNLYIKYKEDHWRQDRLNRLHSIGFIASTKATEGEAMRDIAVFCLALGVGGCASSSYVTYLADAAINPPYVESFQTESGQKIDLYSIEMGSEPRRALFFVTGSGCASLSYYMRAYFVLSVLLDHGRYMRCKSQALTKMIWDSYAVRILSKITILIL